MDAVKIIEKWLEYANYDPEQKKFNLLSYDYSLHKSVKKIEAFMEYDPTGAFAVMYIKDFFTKIVKDKRVSMFDVLTNPEGLAEDVEMWNLFASPDVAAVENSILDSVNALVEQVVDTKMIGERNREAEKAALFDSITSVVEQLTECKIDLFLRGGKILPVTRFSTHIHVFDRLAECLLALETAQDGIYLCYISCGGSADGYFGFLIKSNGNILSINERVDEAFPGMHKRSRNGRWSEEKKYNLFPYDFIFNYSDYDYKGYATKHMIDEEKLAFFNLEAKAYMPLLLAMILLNTKYANTDTAEMQIKYVDSLLAVNVEHPAVGSTALIIPDKSAVAAVNRNLDVAFSAESIMSAKPAVRFDHRTAGNDAHYTEKGVFPQEENIFIKLYGNGFTVDTTSLLEANTHLKRLTAGAGEDQTPNAEFVGTERRMAMVAYKRAREQLAEYIRDRMYEEYTSFGGKDAVKSWWNTSVQANKEKLFAMCAEKYLAVQTGELYNCDTFAGRSIRDERLRFLDFQENCKGYVSVSWSAPWAPLNPPHGYDRYGRRDGKYNCPITGSLTSIFFAFRFNTWKELEEVVGESNLPKIVQGWTEGSRGRGNPNISATDAVWEVGTPFERDEIYRNKRYWTQSRWGDYFFRNHIYDSENKVPSCPPLEKSSEYDFSFVIGFSKRGLAQLIKDYQKKE